MRVRAQHAHEPYLVRAQARLQLNRLVLALGDCYLASSIAPDDAAIYDLRARIYYAIGNLREVIHDTIRADHLRRRAGGIPVAPDPSERLIGAVREASYV
ncbi:MAG: hypothetical protein ACYDCQ_00515 [Dehalococcoidia bacterium]